MISSVVTSRRASLEKQVRRDHTSHLLMDKVTSIRRQRLRMHHARSFVDVRSLALPASPCRMLGSHCRHSAHASPSPRVYFIYQVVAVTAQVLVWFVLVHFAEFGLNVYFLDKASGAGCG